MYIYVHMYTNMYIYIYLESACMPDESRALGPSKIAVENLGSYIARQRGREGEKERELLSQRVWLMGRGVWGLPKTAVENLGVYI